MTLQATPFRKIFTRFFPRRAVSAAPLLKEEGYLEEEQKKELALRYLNEGEMALLQGNLRALSCFEAALNLDGENPQIWYRQGLAFFEYGSEEGKEKSLLLAGKNFKIATQLKPDYFDAWLAWGDALLQLGRFHEEHHFLIEAKDKYQKALAISQEQPKEVLAELYWDYGIAWAEIAQHSGEALDVRLAIEAFQTSKNFQENPSCEFWNDCGKAYLEMGLLINDARLYLQSIEYLQKAVETSSQYFDGWVALAEGYSQLYINTLDEKYVTKASNAYATASKMSPQDPEVWLGWGQLLGESGKQKNDPKMLRHSIEKCARAAQLDREDPLIAAQWIESLSLLGMVTNRLDLIVEAENKAIKAGSHFPDDPEIWLAYGICMSAFAKYYDEVDYYELAIEKLQLGLSMDRSDPELWHQLGLVHRAYANMTQDEELIERAVRFLSKAMDLKPACPTLVFDMAISLFEFSEILDDLPALEQSLLFFEQLLQEHRGVLIHHPHWLYHYAVALEWLGHFCDEEVHFVRAVEIFSHVLLIDPDFPQIHHKIAQCYVHLGSIAGESEYYQRAIHFFRLAAREDEENDEALLDWGICLIHLAHHTLDTDLMHQRYLDAESKITRAGTLGNEGAYYTLACLYSILGRTYESMELIQKALSARSLPPIDDLLDDDWLDNLRATPAFAHFITALEAKLQQTREE